MESQDGSYVATDMEWRRIWGSWKLSRNYDKGAD